MILSPLDLEQGPSQMKRPMALRLNFNPPFVAVDADQKAAILCFD